MPNENRLNYLLVQVREGKATSAEYGELRDMLYADQSGEMVAQATSFFSGEEEVITEDARYRHMLQQILAIDKPTIVYSSARRPLLRIAAAVLLLIAGAGLYFILQQKQPVHQPAIAQIQDVAPGSNKAVLTLADGSVVTLDSAGNRELQQGNTAVKQLGGQLQYDVQGNSGNTSYNTLTTPRGGQFKVKLPDGTMVWLNAASTIRYPTAFVSNERLVEVTGEAYFDVAADARKPFLVKAGNGTMVKVLGTAFNINAYTDEESLNTTLLSGAVQVSRGTSTVLLHPGQQARLTSKMEVVDNVDLDKVTAWKNGVFNFEGATLQEVMRQLQRWYNIEVVFEKDVPSIHFFGEVSRDMTLSGVLKTLEESGVKFKIEGHKLVVTP